MGSKLLPVVFLAVFVGLLLNGCIWIDGLDQPSTADVNEEVIVTLDISIDDSGNGTGWFAVLIPNDWDVISATYIGDHAGIITENDGLPDPDLPPPGYKWWKGTSDEHEAFEGDFVTGTLVLQTGSTRGRFELVYSVGCNNTDEEISGWNDDDSDTITIGGPILLWEYSPEDSIQDTCVGNLDGLKGKDVVVITQGGEVYGLDSNGNLLFYNSLGEQLYKVACGNLDDDPYSEFVITAGGGESTYAYDNNGTSLSFFWPTNAYSMSYDAVIVDLDGDGEKEIVLSGQDKTCLGGWGIFAIDKEANLILPPFCTEGEPIYDLTVNDFDGDSIKDIAGIGPSGGGTVFAVNGSDGSLLWEPIPIDGMAIASGDINNDGMNEIVAGWAGEGGIIFAINGTDGDIIWGYEVDNIPTDIALGNLDDAPGLDVAVITVLPLTVYAIRGNGSPIWNDTDVSGDLTGNDRDFNLVAVADIDRDGKNEVIAGGFDGVYAYERGGTLKWFYPTDEPIADIEIGDVNKDGVKDVIASTPGGFSVYVLTSFIYTPPPPPPSEKRKLYIDETHGCAGEGMTVTVTDKDGDPVAGVEVKLLSLSPVDKVGEGTTDSNGEISFTPSREGDHEITAKRSGYSSASLTFDITCTVECTADGDCAGDEKCENNLCVPVTGKCGYAENHKWVSYECCDDDACALTEHCVDHSCVEVTGECGYPENHQWVSYECCKDEDCDETEACTDHSCTPVSCPCGYIENHTCVEYECCLDEDCTTGEQCVDNECVPLPPEEGASDAIDDAQDAIEEAQNAGRDVTEALEKLQDAQEAFNAGNYELAEQLAEEARLLSLAAKAPAPPAEEAGKEVIEKPEEAAPPLDLLAILGGIILLGLVILVVVGGVWMLLRKKKRR